MGELQLPVVPGPATGIRHNHRKDQANHGMHETQPMGVSVTLPKKIDQSLLISIYETLLTRIYED